MSLQNLKQVLMYCVLLSILSPVGWAEEARKSRDEQAEKILKEMSVFLTSKTQMKLRGDIQDDFVLSSGQKIQKERILEGMLRRPNKLLTKAEGYRGNNEVWYDGKILSLFMRDQYLYAQAEVPGEFKQAFDFITEKYGVIIPLAGLFVPDPYSTLMRNVQTSSYLGVNAVRGQPCHHLLFTQESINWQIWIESGESSIPRKVVITFKKKPAQPQYVAYLYDWNFSVNLPDSTFNFVPPQEAEKLDFLPAIPSMEMEETK